MYRSARRCTTERDTKGLMIGTYKSLYLMFETESGVWVTYPWLFTCLYFDKWTLVSLAPILLRCSFRGHGVECDGWGLAVTDPATDTLCFLEITDGCCNWTPSTRRSSAGHLAWRMCCSEVKPCAHRYTQPTCCQVIELPTMCASRGLSIFLGWPLS